MSIRARLLAVVLAVVMAGLVVADVVTYGALQRFELDQLDSQLAAAVHPVARAYPSLIQPGAFGSSSPALDSLPVCTRVEVLTASGTALPEVTPSVPGFSPTDACQRTHPVIPKDLVHLVRSAGKSDGLYLDLAGTGGGGYRTLAIPVGLTLFNSVGVAVGNTTGVLLIAAPTASIDDTLRRLALVEGAVSAAVVLVAILVAWWLVRAGLRPLDDIVETAGEIATEGDLSRRVERVDQATEVGRLGQAFNHMIARIEGAFAAQQASEDRLRRFVADASHELRTPLTSIRGYAELFRRGAAERPEDLALAMRRIESEALRMGALVEDLLLLARLDQGRPLERHPVRLDRVIADAVSDARAVEPDRPVTAQIEGPAVVLGDEDRLRQLLANLLANVRAHTPPGTVAEARLLTSGATAIVEVADHGPGLGPDEAGQVFERFYRGDASRRRRGDAGAGLGLSIVASVAAAHGGRASFFPTPGGGATFRVELPLATPADLASAEDAPADAALVESAPVDSVSVESAPVAIPDWANPAPVTPPHTAPDVAETAPPERLGQR